MITASRAANRAERRGQWARARRAAQLDSLDRAAKAPAHEILLKRHRAAPAHFYESAHAVVAHRHHLRAHAVAPRDFGRDAAERLAGAHPFGAEQMRCEIAIAKVEPGPAVEAGERAQRVEAFALEAPSGLRIGGAGERVDDRVEVGRDVKSVELLVVAGVDDYAQARLAGHAHQAAQELSRPHPPRKRGDRPGGLVRETW